MPGEKQKRYENRQAGYTDPYTIDYQREDDGTYTLWAIQRPADPYRNSAGAGDPGAP